MDPSRLILGINQFFNKHLNKMTPTSQDPLTETKDEVVGEGLWIDDTFRVEYSKWGTWSSFDKMENKLVISLTEEICVNATRFYLKRKQEGFSSEDRSYSGVVDGKL